MLVSSVHSPGAQPKEPPPAMRMGVGSGTAGLNS